MFKSVKYLFVPVVLNLASCSNTNKAPLIKFSEDSTSIIIKNIDGASLFELRKDYKSNPDSVNFMAVILIPGETDSLQDEKIISGRTIMQGDSVTFKPETPFVKNKIYLVESYIGVSFADKNKLFTGTIKHNLEPHRQILKR
ncbi:hypothetical protein [Pedobacter rhodius]|uniref:Lipoprotein n=1 Tax=Pedobacter rhodius TaxID=3004098 RepID=A0ABT4L0Z2_9SPHI|nr:hypothetical protein [Pedobacter sp. SJ11]MCZ4223768.1 hypothetical protein [Pedobacter sp. SJ11]